MNFYHLKKEQMTLTINRYSFDEASTIGRLYVNGLFFCYTLEDVVRPDGVKIAGQTAIPAGHYEVDIDFSNHFQKLMPHILNVPMFEGIRIHWGNTSKDTEGCILLGKTVGKDFVGHSVEEFNNFFTRLSEGLLTEKCFIDINNNSDAGVTT